MEIKRQKVVDVLHQKQEELARYQSKADDAISIVTQTAQNLIQINDKISEKIQEIDTYKNELDKTKAGLNETKQRNEHIIKNFNALICIEEEEE